MHRRRIHHQKVMKGPAIGKRSYLHLLPLLLLLSLHVEAQSPKGNEISDSAFNEIIANYYNSSPFHSKIDPHELLKEFANKKVVRKRKLRPKKKELKEDKILLSLKPTKTLPLKKIKKRIHLRQRQTTPGEVPRSTYPPSPSTTTTTITTTHYPMEPPRMRNRPVYVSKPEPKEGFSERSYDYEIDYFDRNGLREEQYDEEYDDREPLFSSEPGLEKNQDLNGEEMLYADLENFFPAQSKSDRDPGFINYNTQEYEKTNLKKEILKDPSPPRNQPIYTPKYGHPYAEPLSQPNPIDSGIYDTDYVDSHTGHFDIAKIYQADEKAMEFVPTIPTTTTTTTTTRKTSTTTTPVTRTTTTKALDHQPSLVKSLQRRFPRVNDYEYQKLPSKENIEIEKEISHLKAEHRNIPGSLFATHPGYRDLPPPQRRRTPPRRQFHNTYKEPHFGQGNTHQNSPTQFGKLSKKPEFFVPSNTFGRNVFNSPYSSHYETPKPKSINTQYKALEQQRYPTPKPKIVAPSTRSRFSTYKSSRPKFESYTKPPTYAPPPKVKSYTPPQTYNVPPKKVEYKPLKKHVPQDHTQIDSKFREFRGNSEFSGYLDQSGHKEVTYDYERGFPLLPPPPAMIATTQNFFGFSDVPKLGSKVNYNPPELIYNQMYESQFALGRKDEEEESKNKDISYLNDELFSSRSSSGSFQQQRVQPSPRRRQGSGIPVHSQRYLHKPYQSNGPFGQMYQ